MRTILVDDEPIMLRSFVRNSTGIPDLEVVAQFQNGEDAIAYAKHNTFDIALLDIVLPKMSGIELATQLRAIHPDLLIVFISAHGESVQFPTDLKPVCCIPKPYNRSTIEAMMEKVKALCSYERTARH